MTAFAPPAVAWHDKDHTNRPLVTSRVPSGDPHRRGVRRAVGEDPQRLRLRPGPGRTPGPGRRPVIPCG